MISLTPHQKIVLQYIRNHQLQNRISPSLSQVAKYCGVNINAVRKSILQIEKKGYLERDLGGRILFPVAALNMDYLKTTVDE